MAHKLALCTSQASTGIQFLSTFKETLTALYRYFQKSSLQTQLKEFQEIFQQPQLKVKEVYEIRWFAFCGAIEALHRTWSSLLAYFESHDDPKAKAAGFEKALKKCEFVATMGLMMDVMPIHSYRQLYTAIHDYTQIYIDIHSYTWLYTALHGYTQIYMAIHRYT